MFLFKGTAWRLRISSMLQRTVRTPSSLLQQRLNLENEIKLCFTTWKLHLEKIDHFLHVKRKLKTTAPHKSFLCTLASTLFLLEGELTFVGSCHFIRFGRGIFDSVVVFYKECSFMFKEIIHILQKKKDKLKILRFHSLCVV